MGRGGHEILRVYYYDCLPYQPAHPTPEERQRIANKQRFLNALNRLPRFQVRQGRLAFQGLSEEGLPILEQKRVDLLLGVDLALLAAKHRIDRAVLVSGDSDFVPVVQVAKNEGCVVCLVHGPVGTYHQDLWDEADERLEITDHVIAAVSKAAP